MPSEPIATTTTPTPSSPSPSLAEEERQEEGRVEMQDDTELEEGRRNEDTNDHEAVTTSSMDISQVDEENVPSTPPPPAYEDVVDDAASVHTPTASTTNSNTNTQNDDDNNSNENQEQQQQGGEEEEEDDDDSDNVTEIDLDGADAAQHLYSENQYMARLERLSESNQTRQMIGSPMTTRGLFWTQAETEAYEERRRGMLLRELNRVQRANFIHFCLLFLMPTGLLLVVLLSAFTDKGADECGKSGIMGDDDGGEDNLANCYLEPRTFMNAFASRCICDAFEILVYRGENN